MTANGTVTVTIDGVTHQVPAGLTLVQAARHAGKSIPHYCYHPGLSIAGNCRMCLTKVEGSRKLEIGCATYVRDGLAFSVDHPEVLKARELVMEFLLINHPLDCPTCDKAGECTLQNYSYEHGADRSHMVEAKTQRPRKMFSADIHYVGNRCISCTRCVRFLEEVAGTAELTMEMRGDRSQVAIFPGRTLDGNPLAGNVVDVCPVGALLSGDFLYQQRVWSLERADGICAHCAQGCNVRLDTSPERALKRVRPRPNEHVNRWWMCDYGRYLRPWVEERRLLRHRSAAGDTFPAREAVGRLGAALKGAKAPAVLASGFCTNEELFLLKRLAAEVWQTDRLGFFFAPPGEERRFLGFTIAADRNPNRAGVRALFGAEADRRGAAIAEGANTVLVLGGVPAGDLGDQDLAGLARQRVLVLTPHEGPLAGQAALAIGGSLPVETDGTFVNQDGRVQRMFKALPPPGGLRTGDLLQELLVAAGTQAQVLSLRAVFDQMAAREPAFRGLSWQGLGAGGQPLAAPAATGASR